jgi:hypothetical protein
MESGMHPQRLVREILVAATLLTMCACLSACQKKTWSSSSQMGSSAVNYWPEDESGLLNVASANLLPPGTRQVKIQCASIKPGKSSLVRMDYALSGAGIGGFSYQSADNCTSERLDLGSCKVRLKGGMSVPKQTNPAQRKAMVRGTYEVDVDLPDCTHVAWFSINEFGYLVLSGQKVGQDFSVQLISTSERGLYLAYRIGYGGDHTKPLFGIEYDDNELLTQHDVKLADGWTYNFRVPDGTLRIYPPESLGTLPGELLAVAAEEAEARARGWADAGRRAGGRRSPGNCGGGG